MQFSFERNKTKQKTKVDKAGVCSCQHVYVFNKYILCQFFLDMAIRNPEEKQEK